MPDTLTRPSDAGSWLSTALRLRSMPDRCAAPGCSHVLTDLDLLDGRCPACGHNVDPFADAEAADSDAVLFASAVIETPAEREARYHREWEAGRAEREAWAATGLCSSCEGQGFIRGGECCPDCWSTGRCADVH